MSQPVFVFAFFFQHESFSLCILARAIRKRQQSAVPSFAGTNISNHKLDTVHNDLEQLKADTNLYIRVAF